MLERIGDSGKMFQPVVIKRPGEPQWHYGILSLGHIPGSSEYRVHVDGNILEEPEQNVYAITTNAEIMARRALYGSWLRANKFLRMLQKYHFPARYTAPASAIELNLRREFNNVVRPGRLVLMLKDRMYTIVAFNSTALDGCVIVQEEFSGATLKVQYTDLRVANDDVLAALYYLETSYKCLDAEVYTWNAIKGAFQHPHELANDLHRIHANESRSSALHTMRSGFIEYWSQLVPCVPPPAH